MAAEKGISIKVDEQEDRLRELERKKQENRRATVYGILAVSAFGAISVVFASLKLGWFGYTLPSSSTSGNYIQWAGFLVTAAIPLFLFLVARRVGAKKKELDARSDHLGTFVTPSGVQTYDKRDYDHKVPEGRSGTVTRIKTYAADSPEGNWEGTVRFENGDIDCWSRDDLTKGVKVHVVFAEGGEPEVEYDDDLEGMTGEVKKPFGDQGRWLVYFKEGQKFALATSKEPLEQGMVVKVVTDQAPGVDVLPWTEGAEEE